MISHEQVVNRLREANYTHKRQAPRVELWRQRGTGTTVSVPRCDLMPENTVRVILSQAGLSRDEVETFVVAATKQAPKKRHE